MRSMLFLVGSRGVCWLRSKSSCGVLLSIFISCSTLVFFCFYGFVLVILDFCCCGLFVRVLVMVGILFRSDFSMWSL